MEYYSSVTKLSDSSHSRNSARVARPFFAASAVQPKLGVNTPGDVWENEADRVADHVMRTAEGGPGTPFFSPAPVILQRKCAHCEEEEKKKIQRKATEQPSSGKCGNLDHYVDSLSGQGQSLPQSSRHFFEPRMGADFNEVKIHTGEAAAESASSIGALAYTTGKHIVFNEGQYAPGTSAGQRLLAHELTHVIQQSGGHHSVQRDYAKALPNPEADAPALTDEQLADAIGYNTHSLRDGWEIGLIRDVIGISPEPAVIDQDFVQALAEYQAENNIGVDGKLGPVTSARLSAEMRSETRGLSVAERRDLSRSSRRMGVRAIRIRVNNAAHAIGTRGRADYGVMWDIPDARATGYVIQHLRVTTHLTDCAGHQAIGNNFAGNRNYWEAWHVVNGRVHCGNHAYVCDNSDDTFGTIPEAANTRGTVTMTGHVDFYPDYRLDAGWAVTPFGVHPAGDLPHRTTTPPEWNEGDTMVHQMTVNYDNCAHPATANATSRPH